MALLHDGQGEDDPEEDKVEDFPGEALALPDAPQTPAAEVIKEQIVKTPEQPKNSEQLTATSGVSSEDRVDLERHSQQIDTPIQARSLVVATDELRKVTYSAEEPSKIPEKVTVLTQAKNTLGIDTIVEQLPVVSEPDGTAPVKVTVAETVPRHEHPPLNKIEADQTLAEATRSLVVAAPTQVIDEAALMPYEKEASSDNEVHLVHTSTTSVLLQKSVADYDENIVGIYDELVQDEDAEKTKNYSYDSDTDGESEKQTPVNSLPSRIEAVLEIEQQKYSIDHMQDEQPPAFDNIVKKFILPSIADERLTEGVINIEQVSARLIIVITAVEKLKRATSAIECAEAIEKIYVELAELLVQLGYKDAITLAERLVKMYDIATLKQYLLLLLQSAQHTGETAKKKTSTNAGMSFFGRLYGVVAVRQVVEFS